MPSDDDRALGRTEAKAQATSDRVDEIHDLVKSMDDRLRALEQHRSFLAGIAVVLSMAAGYMMAKLSEWLFGPPQPPH